MNPDVLVRVSCNLDERNKHFRVIHRVTIQVVTNLI